MRLLSKALTTIGKVSLIVAGASFGLVRGLHLSKNAAGNRTDLELLKARIDALDLALASLGKRIEEAHCRMDRTVTQDDLAHTLDRLFGKLETEVDERFERQNRSVEALRLMVGQTDELLQKVLDGLESMRD